VAATFEKTKTYVLAEMLIHNPKVGSSSLPPLPMESMIYSGRRDWPLSRCVQFVSTLRIEHHGFDRRSFVSLSGSNITGRGLDLRMSAAMVKASYPVPRLLSSATPLEWAIDFRFIPG
jgi:hypothetical protein